MPINKRIISLIALFYLSATMLVGLVCPMNGFSPADHFTHADCSNIVLNITSEKSSCHGEHFGILEKFLTTAPDYGFLISLVVVLSVFFSKFVFFILSYNSSVLVRWRRLYLNYLENVKTRFRTTFEYWINLAVKPHSVN